MGRFDHWQAGQRVARTDRDELGVVVEVVHGVPKVKWDRGRTSYYRPEDPANVRLVDAMHEVGNGNKRR